MYQVRLAFIIFFYSQAQLQIWRLDTIRQFWKIYKIPIICLQLTVFKLTLPTIMLRSHKSRTLSNFNFITEFDTT